MTPEKRESPEGQREQLRTLGEQIKTLVDQRLEQAQRLEENDNPDRVSSAFEKAKKALESIGGGLDD